MSALNSDSYIVYTVTIVSDESDQHNYLIAAPTLWEAIECVNNTINTLGQFYGHTRQDTTYIEAQAVLPGTWREFEVINCVTGRPFQYSYSNNGAHNDRTNSD
jgi:hypothetical protein